MKTKSSSRKNRNTSKPRLVIAQTSPDMPVEALNGRFDKIKGTQVFQSLSDAIKRQAVRHAQRLRKKLLKAATDLAKVYTLPELEQASADLLNDMADVLATETARHLHEAMRAAAAEAAVRTATAG